MWLLLAFLLPGCEKLDAASNVVDGLGDTTVAQGIFLGADIPPFVTLPDDADFYSALCKVFLAEVQDASDLGESPVSGADVRFTSSETGRIEFSEEGPGEYRVYSFDGLSYEPGQTANVSFDIAGETGVLSVKAPGAPEFELPESHSARKPMTLELDKGEFEHVVAAVYDIDHDILTWDSLPADVEEAYALNTEDAEVVTEVEIPGEAFVRGSNYLVGVAGLEVADSEGFEGVNRALSTFAAGQFELGVIQVEGTGGK